MADVVLLKQESMVWTWMEEKWQRGGNGYSSGQGKEGKSVRRQSPNNKTWVHYAKEKKKRRQSCGVQRVADPAVLIVVHTRYCGYM